MNTWHDGRRPGVDRASTQGTNLSRDAWLWFAYLPDMAGWRLNPRFSLWLMGYPDRWACCGGLAMQSCRRSGRSLPGRSADR